MPYYILYVIYKKKHLILKKHTQSRIPSYTRTSAQ